MEPALVTRQLGLSSAARHVGFAPVIRAVVDEANKLRYHAFGLITAYYTEVAAGGPPVQPLSVEFVEHVFQLLTGEVSCLDGRLMETGRRYRAMLAAEGIILNRTGTLVRICQSFRANIITSLGNYFNQPYALQRSYIKVKYGLTNSEAKALAARLDRSRAEVEETARTMSLKRACHDEHSALEELSKDKGSPTAAKKYELALAAKAAISALNADDPGFWKAFDAKFPLPKIEDAAATWEAEMALLPPADTFVDLFANFARMAAVCLGEELSRKFAMCPAAGYAVDFCAHGHGNGAHALSRSAARGSRRIGRAPAVHPQQSGE